MKNVLLTIAYDGTDFCGWQKQPGQRSVQEEVERMLGIVCARPIQINGTSRTDARVHAYGQRASFTAEFSIPIGKIPLAANGIFASAASAKTRKASGDVAILAAEEVPLDFHARFDALGKKYIYKISQSQKPNPFQRNYCC
ncbi:MAG: tRNA pseudouridine(38-40) synthase TruA, partial [Eubacteriales bacterium]|nr:tRNA pseudouridine(38-40) synthase TruA [Eubacteriales bacterium]